MVASVKSPSSLLLVFALITPPVTAADFREIPLGIEAVTGYRSEYIFRGFKLGGDLFDFQLEAEVALTNEVMLNAGGWFATETGRGDFEESVGFIGIRQECNDLMIGLELTFKSVSHPVFKNGLDIAPYISWQINEDFAIGGGVAWDTGADGLYSYAEGVWSKAFGESAFVRAVGGISGVADYYDRSGLNDVYARLSYTYGINQRVAVTPFAETSVPLKSHGETVRIVAGLWFEVNF